MGVFLGTDRLERLHQGFVTQSGEITERKSEHQIVSRMELLGGNESSYLINYDLIYNLFVFQFVIKDTCNNRFCYGIVGKATNPTVKLGEANVS